MSPNSEKETLLAMGNAGARWFYGLAALSLANSVALLVFNIRLLKATGLGAHALVDAWAMAAAKREPQEATQYLVAALGVNALAAALFALIGWLSLNRYTAVMAIGLLAYLLDGLVFLAFGTVIPILFHAFVFWMMATGLQAYRKLHAMESEEPHARV